MASIQRKVAFYYLSQERTGEDRIKHAVELPAIEANFQYIYGKMNVLSNGHHAEKILYNNIMLVVEVIQYNADSHLAFIALVIRIMPILRLCAIKPRWKRRPCQWNRLKNWKYLHIA